MLRKELADANSGRSAAEEVAAVLRVEAEDLRASGTAAEAARAQVAPGRRPAAAECMLQPQAESPHTRQSLRSYRACLRQLPPGWLRQTAAASLHRCSPQSPLVCIFAYRRKVLMQRRRCASGATRGGRRRHEAGTAPVSPRQHRRWCTARAAQRAGQSRRRRACGATL